MKPTHVQGPGRPGGRIGDGGWWSIPLFFGGGFVFWGLVWLLERLFS